MTTRMKIKTVVNEIIIPICQQWAGTRRGVDKDSQKIISDYVKTKTGKEIGFQFITPNALKLAKYELDTGKTFSFNIICGNTLVEEFNQSSVARRKRFGNVYHFTLEDIKSGSRFQISLDGIRTNKQFDVQYMVSDDGRFWPVAVIGFYGANINGWSDRVGLNQTVNPHKIPSTHYIGSERASEYVFIISDVANKFL